MDIIPIKLSVTNCFLVKADDKYILIDTGYAEDLELFREGLEKTGVTLSQISHIILTHHHDDHCGLLHYILDENKNIRVVMSLLCKELISKGENDQTHGGGLLNKRVAFLIRRKQFYLSVVLGKKIDKANNLKFTPYVVRDCDILIDADTELRDIGIPLDGRIISTPGHTIDSVSVIFDDGDCLAGDAAASMLCFAGTKNCVIFICDMEEYYKSWQKIIDSGAKKIYPAHGKPFAAERLKANIGRNRAENLVSYK